MKWKFWTKTKKVEEQPKHVGPIVIPEPTVQVHEYKGKIDHNEFNIILSDFYGNMSRIKSDNSHEVVRNVVKVYHNTFDFINVDDISLHYIEKVEEFQFVRRLFVTDNGHFFYQNIYKDDNVKYFPVDRNNIHRDMSIWESPNRKSMYLEHSEGCGSRQYIYPPGTYENMDALHDGEYHYSSETFIDSYEIIDQERYDQLIEVL